MKKKLIICIVLVIVALISVGIFFIIIQPTYNNRNNINEENSSIEKELEYGKIRVTKSSWAGEKDFKKPKPIVRDYEIELNKVIELESWSGVNLKIISIQNNSIQIQTNQAMSDGKNGVSLMTDKTVFTIENGKTLHLVTPTTDAGEIFDIDINI